VKIHPLFDSKRRNFDRILISYMDGVNFAASLGSLGTGLATNLTLSVEVLLRRNSKARGITPQTIV